MGELVEGEQVHDGEAQGEQVQDPQLSGGDDRAGTPSAAGLLPEGPVVTREVDLPADPGEVWDALTDEDRVRAWFGAPIDWEVRPGGALHVGQGDDGAPARHGRVDDVRPGRLLRFRWWPDDGAGAGSTVTYELEPRPGGTHLVITEVPVPVASVRAPRASASSPWDVRVVGLWAGCHPGLRCRA